MTVLRGPWGGPPRQPYRPPSEPTRLEETLRASLEQLGVEVPAADAAEEREVPVPDNLARVSSAFSLQIASFAEAREIATTLCKTNFVPQAYRGKPDEALAAIIMGGELGLGPMQSLQGIAVINGKPTVWGDTALALVMVHPDFAGHVEGMTANQQGASCTIKRRNRPDKTVVFTVEMAQRARLWGKQGPWTEYPERMLLMRARAWAMRDQFADALRGLQIREEVLDYNMQTGAVTVANDVPVDTREVRAVVVPAVPAAVPVVPAPKPAAAGTKPQPVAAPAIAANSGAVVVQQVRVEQTGADFVVASGTNKGKKMGDLKDSTVEWYASQCQDARTKEAAQWVQQMRRDAVQAAISRAQQAQEKAQAEEQAPADEPVVVYDQETGEVLS